MRATELCEGIESRTCWLNMKWIKGLRPLF